MACSSCETKCNLPFPSGGANQARLCNDTVLSFLLYISLGAGDVVLHGIYRFAESESWRSYFESSMSSSICWGVVLGLVSLVSLVFNFLRFQGVFYISFGVSLTFFGFMIVLFPQISILGALV